MARDIGTLQTELNKFSVRTATLVHLDWHTKDAEGIWKSTPLFLTSAGQNIVVGPNTYQGIGVLAGISGVKEGFDISPYSLELSLSGIPNEFIPELFNDISFANAYTNRPAFIYVAMLDDNYQVIDSPILVFAGQMDSAKISIDNTAQVSITVHSRLVNWETPKGGKFNSGTQKARFPLDTGFDLIPSLLNKDVIWGPGGPKRPREESPR